MNNKVMISHATTDQAVAAIVSTLLKKCSLNQILPWFSSDPSEGGIGAGQRWFEKIRTEILQSKAVIILLTNDSIKSSWVQFEAGFGAGATELELIPIAFGLDDITKIPNPISHWQVFNASGVESTTLFVRKVLDAFSIYFDEELVRIAVSRALEDYFKIPNPRAELSKDHKLISIDPEIRRYLDQKFFDIAAGISGRPTNFSAYTVTIHSGFTKIPLKVSIDIDTTLQDVTNDIYFSLDKHVRPYTYLESWVIVDKTDNRAVIAREIQHLIPARLIFDQTHDYEILSLSEPYDPTERQLGSDFISDFP